MPRIPISLGPESDKSKSKQGGGATLTNCYVEKTDGGKTGFAINTRPRASLFSAGATDRTGRGAIAVGNSVYIVRGEDCYKISSIGVATLLGNVLGQKPVTMSVNRKAPNVQITITADTKNYIVENDVLSLVVDLDLPAGVHSNCYIKGRTIYGLNDGTMFWSDNNNSSSINALHFLEAERDADQGVRVYTYNNDVWYFGTKSREIIRHTGSFDPIALFAPLGGAGLGEGDGCAAKNSPATVNGVILWVNDYKTVVASTGGKSERVSTHEVDRDIAAALAVGLGDEITAFTHTIEGHYFYYLRCPLWCWVFDMSTALWFRSRSYLDQTFDYGFSVSAFNRDLLLEVTNGGLYDYNFTAVDDAGQPCIAMIETSPLNAFPDGYICDAFHLDAQSGVGLVSGANHAVDPEVLITVSRDGGMTYGAEYRQKAGRVGVYSSQMRFNRLGSTNGAGMAFRISLPEPVERAVFQASADVRKLIG